MMSSISRTAIQPQRRQLFPKPRFQGILPLRRVYFSNMANIQPKDPLVWIDCEMTGLDAEKESILEIACFITDGQLNLLDDQGFETVIHHEKSRLDQMDEWCTQHHRDSGLTQKAIESQCTPEKAADDLLAYIKQHISTPRVALLAGNSVHADKSFLVKAPYNKVIDHLHYRILDVSTIKEAAKRWAPIDALKNKPRKQNLHEARADILESINEAKFYREVFFKSKDT